MFFNRKEDVRPRRPGTGASARATSPSKPLSPRFARLVRESWWLVIVAAIGWLALILATYRTSDPGWSYSGAGTAIANKGGVAGAWLADLLLYLFGASAWWWAIAGVVLIVASYRRIGDPETESDHPFAFGALGFLLVLTSSCALEALRFTQLPIALPQAPGGAIGDLIGSNHAKAIGYNGAALLLVAVFLAGWSLFFGMSWLKLMESIGGAIERTVTSFRRRAEDRAERRLAEHALAEREAVVEHCARRDRAARARAGRDRAAGSPEIGARDQGAAAAALPRAAGFGTAAARAARGGAAPAGIGQCRSLEYTSRLIERKLADFGVSVRVLAAYPGPVITRFEIEPGVGVKGSQIVNLIKDPRARAVGGQHPRRRDDSGQVVHGPRAAESQAADRQADRDPVVATYNDNASALTLALGKDIRRQDDRRRSRADAASAGRGTTGSGKSVAVNAMILSLLYKAEPRRCGCC
jgi:S-DNA-T family DNA segregation ATPase FtsK/SpoIIIE